MKKLIVILAVLISLTGFSQSPGYGGIKAAEFQQRIIDSSGTYLPNVYPATIDNLYRQGIYPSNIMLPAGYYDGHLGSQIPSDGTGDFDVDRPSVSTTIGPQGYIRPIAANEPRISFENCIPYLSLQKEATQLITQDVNHNDWTKSGATIEGDPSSTVGSELHTSFVNSDFDTYTVDGSGFTAANTVPTINENNYSTISCVIGNMYMVYYNATVNTGAGSYINVKVSETPTLTIDTYSQLLVESGKTLYFIATATTMYFGFKSQSATLVNFTVANSVSVKQVSGYPSPYIDEDGVNDYGAYKLVATSANGSIEYDKTITSGLDYDNSIYIKRVTGTGNILIKDVNNAETVLSDGIQLADNWVKYSINSQSSSTTGYSGLKLAASGDEILIYQPNLIQADAPRSLIKIVSGEERTCLGDVVSNTPPTGTTKITEYFDDGTTNEITTIPSTYTLTQDKNYTKIIME